MCDTCGCNVTESNRHLLQEDGGDTLSVLQNLLSENDHQAAHNRQQLDAHGVLAVNLMSSPGSGKTALLEATIDTLAGDYRIGVIEGDLETENDARRIRNKGVPAIQINTGSACHLDAHMLHKALHQIDLDTIDILFIENVGNLVCPASFDLGQHRNAVLLSVTEGDDKPAKYPVMFRAADLMLMTKSDLLPHLPEFQPLRAIDALRDLASEVPVHGISVRTGEGLQQWIDWLRREISDQQARLQQGHTASPRRERQQHHHHSHG
jgi:hydrogenase nickel incorporation protein HypB